MEPALVLRSLYQALVINVLILLFFFFFVCDCVCARSCQSVTVCLSRPAKPACQSVILSVRPAKPACQSVTVCQACLPASQPCATHQPASQSIGQRIIPCLSVRLDIMREKARKTAEKSGESRTKTRYCYPPEKIGISVKNMEICNT